MLLILLILFSCSQYPMEDDYIYIPELELAIKQEDNTDDKLDLVQNWVYDNINYNLSICHNKTAHETFNDREGECRDRLALMLWLADQYFNIKFEIYLIIDRKFEGTLRKWHYCAYNKEYDFYFGIEKADTSYFLYGQLDWLKKISYEEFLKECN